MAAAIIIRLTRGFGPRLPIAPDAGRRSDWIHHIAMLALGGGLIISLVAAAVGSAVVLFVR